MTADVNDQFSAAPFCASIARTGPVHSRYETPSAVIVGTEYCSQRPCLRFGTITDKVRSTGKGL